MTLYYLAFQNTSNPVDTPYYWNSFQTPATSLATSLLDSTGASFARTVLFDSTTGISKNAHGLNVVGSGDAAWVNQAVITDQTWTFTYGSTMTLGGLDNAKRYSIAFFGSQDGAGTNELSVTIQGVNKILNTSNNSTNIIEFLDVAPISGSITVSFLGATGVRRLCAIRIDEHDYNPYQVDSITDPVEAGGTITFTTSGFASLTAITTNQTGITVSGITGVDGTATVAGWANNAVYPDLPVDVTYTFTDGTNSDTIEGEVIKPAAYTRLPMASPVLTAGYLAGDVLAQTGRTHVSGDIMFHTTYGNFALAADTGYTVSSEGSIELWVRVAAGADAGKMFYYAVSITESGAVVVSTSKQMPVLGIGYGIGI